MAILGRSRSHPAANGSADRCKGRPARIVAGGGLDPARHGDRVARGQLDPVAVRPHLQSLHHAVRSQQLHESERVGQVEEAHSQRITAHGLADHRQGIRAHMARLGRRSVLRVGAAQPNGTRRQVGVGVVDAHRPCAGPRLVTVAIRAPPSWVLAHPQHVGAHDAQALDGHCGPTVVAEPDRHVDAGILLGGPARVLRVPGVELHHQTARTVSGPQGAGGDIDDESRRIPPDHAPAEQDGGCWTSGPELDTTARTDQT
jgi:hypothetical protein